MLIKSVILAGFATLSLASPLVSRGSVSNGIECIETNGGVKTATWWIDQDTDLKDSSDLIHHPVYNKTFSTACQCGDAIRAASGPQAPLFVWNSITKGCYPKGITNTPAPVSENKPYQTLLMPNEVYPSGQFYSSGNGMEWTATTNGARCLQIEMGSGDQQPDTVACQKIVSNNVAWDYGVFFGGPEWGSICYLCTYDKNAKGQVLGYQMLH
ncbi:hypothetical protein HKX48_009348 [Thoreauomyces humboldtii]|nr:hypothetical protein HKX48_009348 [Thoreauomyces humboldtii]